MTNNEYLRDGPTEDVPLLPSSDNERDPGRRRKSWVAQWITAKNITWLFMITVLLISLGDQWMESPQTRIIEAVICYRYYEKVDPSKLLVGRDQIGPGALGGVDEMWCKADAVQGELAMLRGWQLLFDGVPSLLLSIPFGWAADRYGRKPFVLIGLISLVLRASWVQLITWFWQTFDIRMTWLSTIFGSLGGGVPTTTTLCFVVLSDVTPEVDRAGVFVRIGAFNLLANLLMPPFAAFFMHYNAWIPCLGGTVLEFLSAVLFAFSPETLNFKHSSKQPVSDAETNPAETLPAPPDLATNQEPISLNVSNYWVAKLRYSTSVITQDWRIPVLIVPFLGHMLLGISGQLLLQYLSERYGLTLSKATLLATVRSAATVVLLFVVLPWISQLVMRRSHLSHQRKDLYLARISQAFLALGWTLVGLSPTMALVAISLVVASLGQGTALLLRSFLTSLVSARHIARVYSIIAIVDTLGAMFGMPLLAGLYKHGLALGGSWVGLPFYFVGLMFTVYLCLLFSVGLRKGEEEHLDE